MVYTLLLYSNSDRKQESRHLVNARAEEPKANGPRGTGRHSKRKRRLNEVPKRLDGAVYGSLLHHNAPTIVSKSLPIKHNATLHKLCLMRRTYAQAVWWLHAQSPALLTTALRESPAELAKRMSENSSSPTQPVSVSKNPLHELELFSWPQPSRVKQWWPLSQLAFSRLLPLSLKLALEVNLQRSPRKHTCSLFYRGSRITTSKFAKWH